MRLATCLLLTGILGNAGATSLSASFFSFENPAPTPNPQTVSPEAARLILARRLGLSRFHRLGGLDDGTLHQVDSLGGRQQRLLSDIGHGRRPSSMVIVVEGVETPGDIIPSTKMSPSFFISDPPTSSANRILLRDFVAQARSSHPLNGHLDFTARGDALMGSITLDENIPVTILNECKAKFADTFKETDLLQIGHHEANELHSFGALTQFQCGDIKSIIHLTLLEKLARREGASGTAYRDAIMAIKNNLLQLADSPMENRKISVLLMPLNPRNTKRSDQPYGSYSSPIDRSATPQQSGHEVPLSDIGQPPRASPFKASKGLRGPISVCHSSLEECNGATRNCSGRGTCALKYHSGNSSSAGGERVCFACLNCTAEVKPISGGGHKTTYWAGAACHKQDVSTPFLLLIVFTILMVGAVTWGIRLLYSIGQEDLPGVLAAGVAAARPR
ncbi:MAG: hypothetical protein M1840_008373 [Geoglossum simile]|nr:MAG: hypothetical protein M1840_008373 [Geoglossum simile]